MTTFHGPFSAQARDIFFLIVGNAAKVVAIGVGVGLVIAYAATRVIESLLYGVASTDP